MGPECPLLFPERPAERARYLLKELHPLALELERVHRSIRKSGPVIVVLDGNKPSRQTLEAQNLFECMLEICEEITRILLARPD